jgi:iron complex outermembrane receptor protein
MLQFITSRPISRAALAGSAAIAALMTGLGPAAAQEQAATQVAAADAGIGLETVVVTARKRSENVQDVPIAVTAVSGADLEASGTSQIQQLQFQAPGLVVVTPNPRQTSFAIRGLGNNPAANGLSASVGLYIDGVYLDRPGMANFDLLDVDHVEVLRGPQGTLFGKNTTAGAISFSTQAPAFDFGARGVVSGGDLGLQQYQGSVTGPLSDTLAFRLTGYITNRDGYVHDINTGQDLDSLHRQGLRGQLLWKPNEDLSWRLIGEVGHENDSASASVLFSKGPTASANPRFVPYDVWAANLHITPPYNPTGLVSDQNGFQQQTTRQYSVTSLANWNLGDVTLDSVTGWRRWAFVPHNDFDWTSADVIRQQGSADTVQQVSQEFRVTSPSGGAFDYVAGAYYFWRELGSDSGTTYGSQYSTGLGALGNAALNNGTTHTYTKLDNNSYALFAQGTWHFDPQWDLTVGARETYELAKGSINRTAFTGGTGVAPATVAPYSGTVKNANWTPSGLATLGYKPAEGVLAYATLSYGAKAGGFNPTVPQTTTGAILPSDTLKVRPEKAVNSEIGVKSEWLDNRLIVNLDAYWTDVYGYQANTVISDNTGKLQSTITNVGSVRSRGFEGEVTALPLDNLKLNGSLSFNDANYRNFPNAPAVQGQVATTQNLSGKPVAFSPRWSVDIGATYTQPVTADVAAYIGGDLGFKSSSFGYIDDSSYSRLGGYGVVNLRAGLAYDRFDISVWVRNAGDARYDYMVIGASTGSGGYVAIPAEPRITGVTLKASL